MSEINWLAVLVAAVVAQGVGALWYSRLLFASAWLAEVRLDAEQLAQNRSKQPFVIAFVTSLVLAAALGWLIGAAGWTSFGGGIGMGLLTGIGVAAMAAAPHYSFAGRSLRLWLIDSGHTLAVTVVMGAILGLW